MSGDISLVCHYFTAYLIHYFYNSKTLSDHQKHIALLKSAKNYVDKKKIK